MRTYLLRGLAAGLIAGFALGCFQLAVGERPIDTAIAFEEAQAAKEEAAGTHSHEEPVFSRREQKFGLVAATTLFGAAMGMVFGAVFAFVGPRMRTGTVWSRAVRLALTAFAVAWLIPFLKYPTNPPTVGDPNTIGQRTAWYLAMIGVSIATAVIAWIASRRLEAKGIEAHKRQLIVAGGYIAVIGAAFLLFPAEQDPIAIGADVIWATRLSSAIGVALLWTAIGVAFGLLMMRAVRKSPSIAEPVPA
ncbi:MAG: CbtA family protein [Thermoleophilaceae bacterium]